MNVKDRVTKNGPERRLERRYQLGGPLLRGAGSSYWCQHVIYIARYIAVLVLGPTCTRARHVTVSNLTAFNRASLTWINATRVYATCANPSASLASTTGKYRSASLKSESECANRCPRVKSFGARYAFWRLIHTDERPVVRWIIIALTLITNSPYRVERKGGWEIEITYSGKWHNW